MHRSFLVPLFSLALLLGCGGPGEQPPGVEREGHAASASPPSGSAPAPPTTGAIRGEVRVPDHAEGHARVAIAQSFDALARMQPTAITEPSDAGVFELADLPPGEYWLGALIDVNRDGVLDRRVEPFVLWPERVTVRPGETATGIVLERFLNLADPAVRTPERDAEVARLAAAAEGALADLISEPPPAGANPDRLLPTMRVGIAESTRLWRTADSEAVWTFVHDTLTAIPAWAEQARQGGDPLAPRRGWQLFGFIREADRAVIPYLAYVPPTYDDETPLPAVLALHGGGGDHWSGAQMIVGDADIRNYGPDRPDRVWPTPPEADMFVVAPTGDRSMSVLAWRGLGEANALGAVEALRQHYVTDANRMYLTGLSDGGRGAWEIGVRYPDRWAAILVGAGATDLARHFCMNLAHVPVRIIHGAHDTIIPVSHARELLAVAKDFNPHFEYLEVDRGHDIADLCYGHGAAFDWFAQFERQPAPPLVRFRTDSLAYANGPGLVVTQRGPERRFMEIQAQWIAPDRVRITTVNLLGFALRLPKDAPRPITIACNGTALTFATPAEAVALTAEAIGDGRAAWRATAARMPAPSPVGPWTRAPG